MFNLIPIAKLAIILYAGDVSRGVSAGDIKKTVEAFALAAAAENLLLGHVPAAGGILGLVALTGTVYTMYAKINSMLGIKFTQSMLRSVATMILSNIAMNVLALLGAAAVDTVLSFIPGLATVSSLVYAAVCFAAVWTAGALYLSVISAIAKAEKQPSEMTKKDMKRTIKATADEMDISGIAREAKAEYLNKRKTGEYTGNETLDAV